MDGNQTSKSTAWSCRVCPKHFNSFDELRLHEQSHMNEQISYSAAMRPPFDGISMPMYTNSGPTNSVGGTFQGMGQPYRNPGLGLETRSQVDPRGVVSPTMMPSSQADQRIMNQKQPDMRNVMPSSPADVRNMGVPSPADPRNFAASSPADPRSMVPSSPADPRGMFPSSPANMVAHSPAGMVAHSPAGDQRNMIASSPVDQRTVMASSPLDPRMMGIGPHDPRGMATVSSEVNNTTEQRNKAPGATDHRNMVPSSPGMVPSSPADQRLLNTGQMDKRSMGSPADVRSVVPQSPIEPRPPITASQADSKETERSRIQSIVADIRTLENRNSTDHRGFIPPNSVNNTHRREDTGQGFSAVTRFMSNESAGGMGAIPQMAFDGRMVPTDSLQMISNTQPLSYNTGSYLESLTRDLYPQELTGKLPSSLPYTAPQLSMPVDSMGDNRHLGAAKLDGQLYVKHDPFYYQQSFPVRAPPSYDMNKIPAMGPRIHNQAGLQDPSTKVEHMLHNPKQTLHYGQTGQPIPQLNHSQSYDGIPKPDHSNQLNQHNSQQQPSQQQQQQQQPPSIASPIPVHGSIDQRIAYQGSAVAPMSPNYPYSQLPPKANPLSSQIHAPVPSRPVPNQHGFGVSSPPVNDQNTSVQKVTCHVCLAIFPNMGDLSEHMKIHAKGLVSHTTQQKPSSKRQNISLSSNGSDKPASVQSVSQNHGRLSTESKTPNTIPSYDSGLKDKSVQDVKCTVCGILLKPVYLADHMKIHYVTSNSTNEQFECKICKKVFKSKEKCLRHEGHHMRDVRLVYCELCEQAFEFKANYLFHMVKTHGISSPTEPQVGTKKAVPLTGGTIDRSFESEESETEASKLIHCQLCDKETERDKLVDHLKTHSLFECEKCDGVFIQKTEYVAHLMSDHRNELDSVSEKVSLNFSPQKLNSNPQAMNKEVVTPLKLNTSTEKKSTPYVKKTPAEKQKAKEERQMLKEEKKLEKKLIKEKEKAAKREAKAIAKAEAKEAKKLEKQQEKERKKLEKRQSKGVVYESNDTTTTPSILSEDTDRSQAAFTDNKQDCNDNVETKEASSVNEVEKVVEKPLDRPKRVDKERSVEKSKTVETETPVKTAKAQETPVKHPCSQCDKSFATKQELKEHKLKHVRDPDRFYCEICDSSYHRIKEKGYYIYHMMYHKDSDLVETEHPDNMNCSVCHQAVTKDKLVSHIKREHAQYSCEICEWSYSCEKVLVSHMRRIHSKTHKQYVYVPKNYENTVLEWNEEEIEETNNDNASEKGFEINDPLKTIPCKFCERMFAKKQHFERHMRSHAALEDAQIHCELCNKLFGCKGAYLYHILHHPSEIRSDTNTVNDKEALLKAECKNEDPLKSEVEIKKAVGDDVKPESLGMKDESGDIKAELEPEDKSVKVETENAIKPDQVKVTKTVLNPITGEMEVQEVYEEVENNEDEVMQEKRTMEVANELNSSKESVDKKEGETEATGLVSGLVYCKVCSKCLKKTELREHIESHILFSCDLCEFSFLKKQKLNEHRKALHLQDYIADEIRMFEVLEGSNGRDSNKVDIEKEKDKMSDQDIVEQGKDMAKKKRGARILSCSLCNLDLKQDKFVEHLKSHIKAVLRCQFCERDFSKPNIHKMHEKSHERIAYSESDLPHPKLCPICDLKIMSREFYVGHLRMHKRKGPFSCKTCEKVFTSDKALDNHTKVYHDTSVKVYWQEDGEGLKFDPRTARISEVVSDYLTEIREINELFKCNGKPQIFHGITQRKSRDHRTSSVGKGRPSTDGKAIESNVTESETNTESEEKMKTDTSDEEYVPDESENEGKAKRRSGRIATKKAEEASDENDDGEEEDSNDKCSSRQTRKRRHSARLASESSEDESQSYKSRGTKSRKVLADKKSKFTVVKKGNKLLMKRKIGHRVLRSALDKKSAKQNLKKVGLKRKMELRKKEEPDRKLRKADNSIERSRRKLADDDQGEKEYPEKCPVCGTFQFSAESYEAHSRIHTGESKYPCPVCESSFTLKNNLDKHMNTKHPGYTPKNLRQRRSVEAKPDVAGRLKTRTRNLDKDKMEPVSSSTPKHSPKLVVQISPLEKSPAAEKKFKLQKVAEKNEYYSSAEMQKMAKTGKFKCDICDKTISRSWNYTQHMLGHKREDKNVNKPAMNKKDLKKKEKESKPFSCKDCSESFKKKRDLYIHTKVHQADGNGADNTDNHSAMDESGSSNADNSGFAPNSGVQDSSEKNASGLNNAKPVLGRPRKSVVSGDRSDIDEQTLNTSVRGRKRVLTGCDSDSNLSVPEKRSKVSDSDSSPVKGSDKNASGMNVGNVDNRRKSSVSQDSINDSKIEACASQINSASSVGLCDSQGGSRSSLDGVEGNSNFDDSARSECSDMEDRKLHKVQTPIMKLTAEKALQKWREKVQATLASQLELHAAKKQEKLSNPDIARLKEKLSTKAKSEVKNFECRICGEKFNAETAFRKHMEEHLYESPPYCSICDIYFMAIYPKKRLAEHNRKKHPII